MLRHVRGSCGICAMIHLAHGLPACLPASASFPVCLLVCLSVCLSVSASSISSPVCLRLKLWLSLLGIARRVTVALPATPTTTPPTAAISAAARLADLPPGVSWRRLHIDEPRPVVLPARAIALLQVSVAVHVWGSGLRQRCAGLRGGPLSPRRQLGGSGIGGGQLGRHNDPGGLLGARRHHQRPVCGGVCCDFDLCVAASSVGSGVGQGCVDVGQVRWVSQLHVRQKRLLRQNAFELAVPRQQTEPESELPEHVVYLSEWRLRHQLDDVLVHYVAQVHKRLPAIAHQVLSRGQLAGRRRHDHTRRPTRKTHRQRGRARRGSRPRPSG
mmetsp:Transcript_7949/g.22533  ORF Transcript_7949/g.22533 Transcript_7949/m.22533 type:complete len:328 (+) Transcript_7949:642-1625(+)